MTINDKQSKLVRTARTTGIWYLLMAITGILGFLIFHPQVFDSEDAEKTLTNLIDLNPLPEPDFYWNLPLSSLKR